MEDHKTPLPVPSPSAIFKPLPEGRVIFLTDTEVHFGVNTLGARIWELAGLGAWAMEFAIDRRDPRDR